MYNQVVADEFLLVNRLDLLFNIWTEGGIIMNYDGNVLGQNDLINHYKDFFERNDLKEIYMESKKLLSTYLAGASPRYKDYFAKDFSYSYDDLKDFMEVKSYELFMYDRSCYDDLFEIISGSFTNILGKSNYFDQNFDEEKLLIYFFLLLPALKEIYDELDISENIFFDTIGDIFLRVNTYKKNHVRLGVLWEDGNWLTKIFLMRIFKLGALQFEMVYVDLVEDYPDIEFDENKLKKYLKRIPKASPILSVHIMEGVGFTELEVDESIDRSRIFFKEVFSEFRYKHLYCFSWMLYSGNKRLLSKDSNIIKFASRFDIIGEAEEISYALTSVFCLEFNKANKYDYDDIFSLDLPRETKLQRAALRDLSYLGVGLGILKVI